MGSAATKAVHAHEAAPSPSSTSGAPDTSATSLKERLIGLLPTLCLIHCIGTAIIGSVMPAAALWMHNPWLEGVLSLLSGLLIGFLILRRRAGFDLLTGLFLGSVGIGLIGWIAHLDFLRHGSLLLLVGVQLLWLRQRRAEHSHAPGHRHVHVHGHGHGHGHDDCGCTASAPPAVRTRSEEYA